ncbi:uncharacterized protein DFL_008578 [Arthrobotrys flagrans]|uniref:Uncharacterized protein n=1 Tax=Arthrobotrys flagrans TaxID=97331 RepID=A0A436ZP73_ARTFL|nr:hypothetical protein DFL_008578 [Arthrobotrys flagrans]
MIWPAIGELLTGSYPVQLFPPWSHGKQKFGQSFLEAKCPVFCWVSSKTDNPQTHPNFQSSHRPRFFTESLNSGLDRTAE